jgi:hypothetical protein
MISSFALHNTWQIEYILSNFFFELVSAALHYGMAKGLGAPAT